MAQWTLQHGTEIIDGGSYKVHANHLLDNFNGLSSDINDRLSMITTNPQTVAAGITWGGAQTFSAGATFNSSVTGAAASSWTIAGTVNHTGHANFGVSADNGTPVTGDLWYNTTTNLWKGYVNGVTQTFYHTGNLPAATAAAVKADQTTGTSTTTYVNPGVQQYHASAVKAWFLYQGTGTPAILASYNVSSITRNGTGDYTANFTTAFSTANYAGNISGGHGSATGAQITTHAPFTQAPTTTTFRFGIFNNSGILADFEFISGSFFGAQ